MARKTYTTKQIHNVTEGQLQAIETIQAGGTPSGGYIDNLVLHGLAAFTRKGELIITTHGESMQSLIRFENP